MLMKHEKHGWHNALGIEVEDMKKNGWEESSYDELKAIIAAKTAQKVNEDDTIEVQDAPAKGKPGRKPKIYLGGINGDNSDKD